MPRLGATCFLVLSLLLLNGCVTQQRAAKQASTLTVTAAKFPSVYSDSVVLLHGLVRHGESMEKMARQLSQSGYRVCNIDYPSRYFPVETLANDFVLPRIQECQSQNKGQLHFVTHSMGGIIVRALGEFLVGYPLGRFVMLSPPNQGSELSDRSKNSWLAYQINGPAGQELGTSSDSLPNRLAEPVLTFGVIAAKNSNSFMSFLIPGDDDGKVSLERMQLAGMQDFIVIDSTHSFMMQDWEVIEQTLYFLAHKKFYH